LRSPASCAVDGHEQGYDAIVVAVATVVDAPAARSYEPS
jgi:hypothetical protein